MNNKDFRRVFLCADIGTSSLKAALISPEGNLEAFVREAYPSDQVLCGHIQAQAWEAAFRRAVGALYGSSKGKTETAAICISGNGPTLIPVLNDGHELEPLHWHDQKVHYLKENTDKHAEQSLFLPHAAWLLHKRPELYEQVRCFFSSQEWLSWKLGAEAVTSIPSPAYEPVYWDRGQCAVYGLDWEKFPPMVLQGKHIGTLSATAAAELHGLSAGIPIIAGGPDFITALIGVGAIEEGIVCDRAGTSEGINVCTSRPCTDSSLRTLPHVKEGLFNVAAILPTTGRLFEWFRNITGQENRDYRDMLAEIVKAPAGSVQQDGGFFFPDIRAAGSLSTASAFLSTAGLTTRAELGRTVVEAIGFLVRNGVQTLKEKGYPIDALRVSGGQAKNPIWNQFKADICGHILSVPEIEDGELAGNACLALTALKEADSIDQAVSRIVRIKTNYYPDPAKYALHAERFAVYQEKLSRMEQFFG